MSTFLLLIIIPKILFLPFRRHYDYIANHAAAAIATLAIIFWSGSMKSASGYGSYLAITLSFCWLIYAAAYFAYKAVDKRLPLQNQV